MCNIFKFLLYSIKKISLTISVRIILFLCKPWIVFIYLKITQLMTKKIIALISLIILFSFVCVEKNQGLRVCLIYIRIKTKCIKQVQIFFIYNIISMTAYKCVMNNPCVKCIQWNTSIPINYSKPWWFIAYTIFKNVRKSEIYIT